jgi:hypothetical protein
MFFGTIFQGSAITKGIRGTSVGTGENEFFIKTMPNNSQLEFFLFFSDAKSNHKYRAQI